MSTLQSLEAERGTQLENIAKEIPGGKTQGVTENLVSPLSCDVPEIYSNSITNTIEEPLKIIPGETRGENSHEVTATAVTSPVILVPPISLSTEELACSFINSEGTAVSIDSAGTNEEGVTVEEVPLSIPFQQIQFLTVEQSDDTAVLTPRSPDESNSQEPLTRLIPVVEVPGYTGSGEYVNVLHEGNISPHRDVFLSAMTTISQDCLSDLGVTLSPLLSPLGILLSPGGDRNQDSTITVLVESKDDADKDETILNSGFEENCHVPSGLISGICTDMTSIAASVEVTTDQRDKQTPLSTGKTRRKSRTAQIVPSVSPLQASENDSTHSTPRCRNRRACKITVILKTQNHQYLMMAEDTRENSKTSLPSNPLMTTLMRTLLLPPAVKAALHPGECPEYYLLGRGRRPVPVGE